MGSWSNNSRLGYNTKYEYTRACATRANKSMDYKCTRTGTARANKSMDYRPMVPDYNAS